MSLSSLKFLWWTPLQILYDDDDDESCLFLQEWRFGRSRPPKVIDIGANRKRVCDFLLVRHSNLGEEILQLLRMCS